MIQKNSITLVDEKKKTHRSDKTLNQSTNNKINRLSYLNKWQKGASINIRLPTQQDEYYSGLFTGFVMGEGSFAIGLSKSKTYNTGFQLKPMFKIKLKREDNQILYDFKQYLGCGRIAYYGNAVEFSVGKFQDILEVIIPFFDQYPIQNIKQKDFDMFKIICFKILNGEGKSIDGIKRILSIRNQMNNGGYTRTVYKELMQ